MTKKIFFGVLFVSLWFAQTTNAQFATGALFDEAAYNQLPQLPIVGLGFDAPNIPPSHSVKRYAPIPKSQGYIGSCVGWALAYGVQTIEWAKRKGITDKDAITQAAWSGMYIYNHVKINPSTQTCDGSYFEKALEFLKQNGNIKFSDYNPNNCQETPPQYFKSQAFPHRIKDFTALFQTGDSRERKLGFIKNAIAHDKPILLGMKLTKNFQDAKGIWTPQPDSDPNWLHAYHAMTLVGYDDNTQTVEIMNSWGSDWGDGGFIKMYYNDFLNQVQSAYQIVLADLPEEKTTLAGSFDFHYSVNLTGQPMANAPVYWNQQQGLYELQRKDWQQGQRFQLLVNTTAEGQYLYVFSVNASYKATWHFPVNIYQNTDIVPLKTEFVIPEPLRDNYGNISKQRSFKIDPVGTDYLIILYAAESLKNELNQISDNTRNLMQQGYSPLKALQNTLGSRLMSAQNISYRSEKAAFYASASRGKIAPLIIRVDSQ